MVINLDEDDKKMVMKRETRDGVETIMRERERERTISL